MARTRVSLAAVAVVLVAAAAMSVAQAPEIPAPKPGPEHKLLEKDAGTWDATVEMFGPPGTPPMVSKGVETNTLGCGGLCLISDFKGELAPGHGFHGHGTSTWDPNKKKYVGTWTDSMSAGIMLGESTYDNTSKTMTGWTEGSDPSGAVVKTKSVVHYKDDDTRVFSMYQQAPGGKEVLGMKITYTRRK